MTKKNIISLILLYIVLFVSGSALLILSFHINLFTKLVSILFYRGLMLILLWSVVIAAVMLFLKIKTGYWKNIITVRDILLLFVAFGCVWTVFFTHLPVTAERSVSVFMLGYMAENQEHSFSEDEIEEFFVDKYVNEYGAFDKRFYEQLKTGTIEKTDDTYHITERGKKLIGIYDVIAGLFNIDRKLIHPQSYTK